MKARQGRALVLGTALLGAAFIAMPSSDPPPHTTPACTVCFCPAVCNAQTQAEARRYIGRLWRDSVDACACEAP